MMIRSWLLQCLQALLDIRFGKSLTLKVMPLLYVFSVVGVVMVSFGLCVEAFAQSVWYGLMHIMLISPLMCLVGIVIVRCVFEFLVAVFFIQAKLSTMTDEVSHLNHGLQRVYKGTEQLTTEVTDMKQHIIHVSAEIQQAHQALKGIEDMANRIPFLKKPKKTTRSKSWAEAPLSEYSEPEELSSLIGSDALITQKVR